ncbi:thioredoxin-dependent thiol peroxidase [Roseomonas populi]|uniref:thioredoxin-dependent peroxiredoxin n=1 Tax=Roseomonas populi TaxID=3121582 RepID=A0ABT1X366_9PROT|nr:thioredoxin-dependent thiol peroxidase [Roseomonas pecuniae]MCR0982134.1 thioredoxin-dependent thiol peroxidase [Roseomonas pecuniae]
MIEVGEKAPEFDLPANGGGRVSAALLRGRRYALYFYPKADTSGCTVQAQGVQENLEALQKAGITVIGVSPDPVKKLDAFAKKFGLTFPLASDAEQSLANAYGTWVEKSMYGRKYMGMERSTFLVGEDGTVKAIWRKVKPAEHAALLLGAA